MSHLSRLSTVTLSAAVLGLVIAGCQPQGDEPPAAEEMAAAEETAAAEVEASEAPAMADNAISGAGMHDMFAGNTILGVFDAWKLRWSEYFAPDGTAQALLRFEGQDDQTITGTYYTNDQGEFCTDYPELDEPNVFCSTMVSLDDGTYQQVYADGSTGSIYLQILEGEQLDALE